MPPESPLDLLADELGAVAGRVERELRQGFAALVDRHEARMAQIELAAMKAEQEREQLWRQKVAELRDGRDADIEPIRQEFDALRDAITIDEKQLFSRVDERLATLKAEVEMPEAPEFIVTDILRAIASVEAQPANEKLPAFVLNLNAGEPKRKTITMRKDRNGNPIADVVEG